MKTAYTIIEENNIKTIFLFFLYGIIFAFLGFIIYFITNEIFISLFIFAYAFFYSFLNILFGDRLLLWLTEAKKMDRSKYEDVYRMVENLSIAAGLPKIPEVYLIEIKDMNAFAIGSLGENYKVVLTEGIIKNLDKNELEGVIAHEISHIKNKDTKIMTRAVLLAGAISIITEIFLRSLGSNSRNKGGSFILLIIIITSILAPLFASLIKFAISRKREFIADSSAALLTRDPLSLASALEKVSKSSQQNLQNVQQIAALCIVSPFKGKGFINKIINNLFSTHPPVEERIKILKSMVI
ncbi:MAG: M48 family metallopeptidase [candidate division WOR-3 bacterium]